MLAPERKSGLVKKIRLFLHRNVTNGEVISENCRNSYEVVPHFDTA
jgi:hypothetical protein